MLEPKEMMKRRGVPSPDIADALACTFGAEIATLPVLSEWAQQGSVVHDYDPLSQAALEGNFEKAAGQMNPQARYYAEGWSRMKEYE
jgi:hypothetical protein